MSNALPDRSAPHVGCAERACECVVAERDRYRRGLLAVRSLIEPSNPCHDDIREALLDALRDDPGAAAQRHYAKLARRRAEAAP